MLPRKWKQKFLVEHLKKQYKLLYIILFSSRAWNLNEWYEIFFARRLQWYSNSYTHICIDKDSEVLDWRTCRFCFRLFRLSRGFVFLLLGFVVGVLGSTVRLTSWTTHLWYLLLIAVARYCSCCFTFEIHFFLIEKKSLYLPSFVLKNNLRVQNNVQLEVWGKFVCYLSPSCLNRSELVVGFGVSICS